MPTIATTHNFKRAKKPIENETSPLTSPVRADVTEIEFNWNPNLMKCQAPPCDKTFWWSTKPKTIRKDCKKVEVFEPYQNVMHDRRVVRGTNFGPSQVLDFCEPFVKNNESRRKRALAKCRKQRGVLGTPPPVAGRKHEVIQTDKYLEDIMYRPIEISVDTQTDLFLERPPTPPYIPAKIGVDKSTEIGEDDLFHFDVEAQPIIDVLVDGAIEQSMLEVAHEKEIVEMRKRQEELLAIRNAELAELRRLEEEEIRLQREKERRIQEDIEGEKLDEEMQKGITAAKLLQGHIAGLLPEILDHMEPATDAVKKEKLFKTVCPWLSSEVAQEVGQIVDSREILTVIIQEIIKQRAHYYVGYKEESSESEVLQVAVEEEGEEGEIIDVQCKCDGCPSSSTLCPSSEFRLQSSHMQRSSSECVSPYKDKNTKDAV